MINLIPFQGTTSALKELEAKELFTEEKVGGPKVKGIEAKERTFIASQSERSMLESLSKSLHYDASPIENGKLRNLPK